MFNKIAQVFPETYEVTTNGNVEDDVQRLASKGLPDSLVTDRGTLDLVELNALPVPGDSLVLPVAAAEVELAGSQSQHRVISSRP